MPEISYVDFRKYANTKLNILKEEHSNQYAEYVMKNFGKLHESVDEEDLYHIAKYNDIERDNINILKNAQYDGVLYDYFIYDDRKCVGVNKEGRIVYIGDYIPSCLLAGNLMENKK